MSILSILIFFLFLSSTENTPCLDPLACNFNEEGECVYFDEFGDPCVIEGCTIEQACNFNPLATLYDGSCEFESCLGCTDEDACNFNQNALIDDGFCLYYIDCNGVCGGDWTEDACGNCFAPNQDQYDTVDIIDFNFSGETASLIIPDGLDAVFFEVFGAQGGAGAGNTEGGRGGYVSGYFLEDYPMEFLVSVGSQSGFNGGGNGGASPNTAGCDDWMGGAGGFGGGFSTLYSSNFIGSTIDDELICIAGGGGGGGSIYCNCCGWDVIAGHTGGFGGGLSGGSGDGGGVFWDTITGPNGGEGASQLAGGIAGQYSTFDEETIPLEEATDGDFFLGGAGASSGFYGVGGGGGGGGYYGGGGGGCGLGGSGFGGGGGGGGSSFLIDEIANGTLISDIRSGDGLVRIHFLSLSCNPGCMAMEACNYDSTASSDDGSCFYVQDPCDDNNEETINDTYTDDCECAGTEVEIVPGCVYETACNFNPEANQDDMSCSFPGDSCDDDDVSTGNDTYTDDCDCVGEPLAGGCTYESACNFNPDAQFDDNSCVFIGDTCDDGDSETEDDVINADCDCAGNPVTSVSQLDVESLSVYPNPVSYQLTVELGSLQGTSVLVKIFDSQGKLVFDENRTGTFIIDVSTYNTGVYSISVENESELIKAQFLVE